MIERRGNKYCVVHGHTQKKRSKTDKPIGTIIKCFNSLKEATAMHNAIIISQRRNK